VVHAFVTKKKKDLGYKLSEQTPSSGKAHVEHLPFQSCQTQMSLPANCATFTQQKHRLAKQN